VVVGRIVLECIHREDGSSNMRLTYCRCFLFLVNYARMKPEVALKALPTLEEVC